MGDQRYTENPDIQWALDLLRPDPNYEPSIMQKYTSEAVCTGTGLLMACARNLYSRRPIMSGLQIHVLAVTAGYLVSQIANKLIDDFKAERDTRLRNYVILHPELFPKPERVKYADVFKKWTPVR